MRTRERDRQVMFNRLFVSYYGHIVRYAERRISDAAVAEEIAADTFRVAWEKLDPLSPFDLPWLYRTASHKVMNHWTREKGRRSMEAALCRLVEEPGEQAGALERIAMRQALEMLSPREREALTLTVWEGLDAHEVAEHLDCTIGAVWKLLSRARANLRRHYEAPTTNEDVTDAQRR